MYTRQTDAKTEIDAHQSYVFLPFLKTCTLWVGIVTAIIELCWGICRVVDVAKLRTGLALHR